jgi:acyl carrier protein
MTHPIGPPAAVPEPISPTERTLAALWIEVLELKAPPNPTDSFISLGGDSMAVATLEYRIYEELQVKLPPGVVFGTPILRELALLVDSSLSPPERAESRPQSECREPRP